VGEEGATEQQANDDHCAKERTRTSAKIEREFENDGKALHDVKKN
jgi:hypothetical protein